MKTSQGELISVLINWGESVGVEKLDALLDTPEPELDKFAIASKEAGDTNGAMLAFLMASLSNGGRRAVTRRVRELNAQRRSAPVPLPAETSADGPESAP